MADEVIIIPKDNGSLHVKGNFKINTPAGVEIAHEGGEAWLCRCGASAKKPFCDGSHKRVNFQSKVG
ncbi:MAG: CDGSH iron-sulfur domain-containing protein [bacterium]